MVGQPDILALVIASIDISVAIGRRVWLFGAIDDKGALDIDAHGARMGDSTIDLGGSSARHSARSGVALVVVAIVTSDDGCIGGVGMIRGHGID